MRTIVTERDIYQGLKKLGIKKGNAIEVHCSMHSFGHVEGGANTVICALKSAVGSEGSIVMPAFKLSPGYPLTEADKELGLTQKIKLLKNDDERSAMGAVADTFRKRSDVKVGEGTFRIAAWGKDADIHAEKGFQQIIDSNSPAVLFGVDIYRLSSMHYVEASLPQEIKNKFLPSPKAREIYPEKEWLIEAWTPPEQPWYKIQKMAFEQKLINTLKIGECTCMVLPVQTVVNLYKKELEKDAFGLYGLSDYEKEYV